MPSVRAFVALFIVMLCVTESVAQRERVLPRRGSSSLEGTSFAIGFMQNELLEAGADSDLSLFISSEFAATVVIDFPNGARRTETLVSNSVRVVPIDRFYEVNPSEIPQRKAIYITSNFPIIVYAMSTKQMTTDTYTAIPIPYLGTDHYSVNRPNDYYEPNLTDTIGRLTPRGGQFMVVATESGTSVTITPACATEGGGRRGVPFTQTLSKGECLLVRGAPGIIGSNDLTGSRIQTTKPVALLSGHVRSSIPTLQKASKDHLVEMLPSVDRWGSEYVTTPLALVEGGDYVRMVAAADNTVIQMTDNSGTRTIQLATAGSWTEVYVTNQTYWKSAQKFLLVQFMPSSSNNPNAQFYYLDYDPAMVVVPALSQYVMGALFQFPILQTQANQPQVRYYFINLVADSVAVPSLKINGVPVTQLASGIVNSWIPGTSLRWAQVRLSSGVFSIVCDTGTFSGVMYGTSNFDSYANLFGLRWGPLPKNDNSPPVYALTVDCGHVTGTITDVSDDTAAVDEIIVRTPPTKNYNTYISPSIDSIGTKTIDATVRDMWKDAVLAFHTYDKQGNGKEWMYEYDAPDIRLPQGFTIFTEGTSQVCVDAWIVNIDSTPVTIQNVTLQGDPRFSLGSIPPRDTVLAAGDSVRTSVCFTPSADTVRRTASVSVELPCGLKKNFVVNILTDLSLSTKWIDFGPVRIGDTACGPVSIINDGESPITITSLVLSAALPQFTPNVLALALPHILPPGDTLLVSVCFVPTTVGSITRKDSVVTTPHVAATIGYTGRGIRPTVPDIVIDWGKRRIGSRHDSVFTMNNLGDAACVLNRLALAGDSLPFDFGTFGSVPIALPTVSSSTVGVAFTPNAVSSYAADIPFVVDWRFHDTVHVRFIGEGIVPAVETYDIDMGSVVIGSRRDSVPDLVRSYGSERLTVRRSELQGPDQGAFELPTSLLTLQGMATPSTLADRVGFIPQRVGYHAVTVALHHDAMPGYNIDTSYVTFHGVGILPDTTGFQTSLIIDAVLDACVDTSAIVRIENSGNTDNIIYDVDVFNGNTLIYSDTTTPFVLYGHSARDIDVPFTPNRNWNGMLRSVVRHGNNQTDTKNATFSIRVPSLEVVATPEVSVSPGASIALHTAVRGSAVQHLTTNLTGQYSVPADRLAFTGDLDIVATVDDAIGTGRQLPLIVTRESENEFQWVLGGAVQSPFEVRWTILANSLWKNTREFDVTTTVEQTICADGNRAVTTITNELCAGTLRAVHFGAVPSIAMRVAPNPVSEEFDIEVISSDPAEISLHLVTTSGERFLLAEKILLIKGTQHVKFSRSQWASGLYLLVLQHGNAESGLPVMLVK